VALAVVFIVRVEEPPGPVIEDGLKPPLVMPFGNPDSLPTLRLTVPLKPLRAATVTVKVADWPGRTARDEGVTAIEKSGLGGSTVIVRVGGLVVFGRNNPSPYTVNGRPLYVHLNGLAVVLLK
jgi:hypothetical protein